MDKKDASQFQQRFDRVYDRLNAHQRAAVDHTEGPVMVIAGPGTGKTQILASRIGKILKETDFLPHNILCLTYTDAGTVAICNEVIQENLSLFEKNSLDPISDLERIELMKELIDALPKNNPLKRYRGDVYYDISHLSSLFSTIKREGWSIPYLKERIEQYIQELPFNDAYIYKRNTGKFQKGDLKKDKIQAETDKMLRTLAAIEQFDGYQKKMSERNRYDFDDMINWVIQAFIQFYWPPTRSVSNIF
jgi:DNA helicase-2/ATP-dependent DNA helicase PcrA